MAVDYFMKIEGVPGESKDDKHKGEIDVVSFSWGTTQNGTMAYGGGGGGGKVDFQDFQFMMKIDRSLPKLLEACATGWHLSKAMLTVRKAGKVQQEFLKYTFTDLLVSGCNIDSGRGDDLPTAQITINYAKIEFEYREQKADGTMNGPIKGGWNVKTNQAI
jgi:type VI secretion system secreted protein Hcp